MTLIVTNNCNETDTISGNIEVVNSVQAAYTQSEDTVCENASVNYDGSGSIGPPVDGAGSTTMAVSSYEL